MKWVISYLQIDSSNGPTGTFSVVLRDATNGHQVPTGLPSDTVVTAVSSTDAGAIDYAVSEAGGGPLHLVSCAPRHATCVTDPQVTATHLPIILADAVPYPFG